jgi:alpha-L-rhamnosidase
MNKRCIFCLTLATWSVFSLNCIAKNTFAPAWSAQWIGISPNAGSISATPQKNLWTCLRKGFFLPEKPKAAEARIAVDSKYWLWVNGKMAVFEGGLKRGPNPQDTYFDVVDLAPYLREGSNTIAVLAWHWGKPGFSYNCSGQAGFVFELVAGKTKIISDATWKAIRHPAYGNTGEPHPNFRLPDDNVHFDARLDLGDWTQSSFDDSAWPCAATFGQPPVAPWNHLIERPIPQWRISPLMEYEKARELPHISDGKPIIAKLPRNITISPYLKIKAPAGLTIDLRTDNYNGGSAYNYRSEYVTKDGVQEFESLPYLNGHWMIYSIPAGVEILGLRYRESRYDTDWVGRFDCDDPFLNSLWLKARNTMNVNMRDSIQDPDRERAQWWGDEVILMDQILYTCDDRALALVRKGIDNLVDWRKPDGALFSPIPAGNWDKELPMQMLASIGEKGFWNYYLQTGDKATIEHAYPAVKKYSSLWRLGTNGLMIHRPGGWDWADWGENIDVPVIENAWLYQALDAAVKMARLTGHDADVAGYKNMRDTIAANYNRIFWNGKEYRSPGYTGETDERGHALAVVFGLAKPDQWPAIKQVFASQFHGSPYMEKYVLESLFLMQEPDAALARMKKRYQKMVESPYTTLWEGWGIGNEGFGGGTYNHGWCGGPLALMMEYVAGVTATSPGFATFQVKPELGPLTRVSSVTHTVNGLIEVDIHQTTNSFELTLQAPQKTSATVFLPLAQYGLKNFFVNGKPAGKVSGVQVLKTSDGFAKLVVTGGTWKFEAR